MYGLLALLPGLDQQHTPKRAPGLSGSPVLFLFAPPQRVTVRRTHSEHIFSALPTIAVGREPCQHLRSAPASDINPSGI